MQHYVSKTDAVANHVVAIAEAHGYVICYQPVIIKSFLPSSFPHGLLHCPGCDFMSLRFCF